MTVGGRNSSTVSASGGVTALLESRRHDKLPSVCRGRGALVDEHFRVHGERSARDIRRDRSLIDQRLCAIRIKDRITYMATRAVDEHAAVQSQSDFAGEPENSPASAKLHRRGPESLCPFEREGP